MPAERLCLMPGCSARPYKKFKTFPGSEHCKVHTVCSEPDCDRTVGPRGGAPAALGRALCPSHWDRFELYGATSAHQRKGRSDKGSWRPPDKVEDSVAGHPRLAALFVRNLSHPDRTARDTPLSVIDRCLWRCATDPTHPQHIAQVNNCNRAGMVQPRTLRDGTVRDYVYPPSSCPVCAPGAMIAQRRQQHRRRLRESRPELAAQFVRCVSDPSLGLELLSPQSSEMCEWRCACGELVTRKPLHLARGASATCNRCIRTGQSRLEWSVAELIRRATGLEVLTGQKLHGARPDLWIPELVLAVDLDPAWTHSRSDAAARDRRKAAKLAEHVDFRRARPVTIPPTGSWDLAVPAREAAEDFAAAVLAHVVTRGRQVRTLTPAEILAATVSAELAWHDPALRRTVQMVHPEHAALIVRCVSEPGLDWRAAPVKPLAKLRFEVRCSECRMTREVTLFAWLRGSGRCRSCGLTLAFYRRSERLRSAGRVRLPSPQAARR
jgi:hypothetical protein